MTEISNDFMATLGVVQEPSSLTDQVRMLIPGLASVGTLSTRQRLNVELGQVMFRLSYKDFLVVSNVLQGSKDRLLKSFEHSLIPAMPILEPIKRMLCLLTNLSF